jgi:hypothetical protein
MADGISWDIAELEPAGSPGGTPTGADPRLSGAIEELRR